MPGPALVTIDIGGTLGVAEGPTLTSVLLARSPVEAAEARRLLRHSLHTAPSITDELIARVCALLEIPTRDFPRDLDPAPLRLLPDAPAALTTMTEYMVTVTLSNVTCVDASSGRERELLAPWIRTHFPSCELGYAKPDPRAFITVAARCATAIGDVLHIGDDWECDVLGAVRAGAQAIWIAGGRPLPEDHQAVNDRIRVVPDLRRAAAYVRELCRRTES